jgi:autotransporter-associated beta strand protein
MNTLIAAAIRCSLMFLIPSVTYAISAQWDLDPISGDWNTADNWTPNGVPNGPADIATFGLSNTIDVSISANTEVNGITFTSAATNPYTVTASPGLTLTISGAGIVNNSGITQGVDIAGGASNNGGTIAFSNSATAGSNVSIFNEGGTINFLNRSTAGGATIGNFAGDTNFGTTNFFNGSTAGGAGISNENGGTTNFFNRSTAGNSTILNQSGSDENGGTTNFFNRSTAGNSTILNQVGSVLFANNSTAGSAYIFLDRSFLQFANNSTAANSTIETYFSSTVQFTDNSTAGSAFIGASDGSFLQFSGTSTAASASIFAHLNGFISFEGSSRGGTAQIDLSLFTGFDDLGSHLYISGHNAPGVTIGSLSGEEGTFVDLGANNLTVGSNNLNTTFSGVIQDGGIGGGGGGSLTKIGSGTLTLSGTNTYTGNTNVRGGVLQVDGWTNSNTAVHGNGTLAGTGTVYGNVTNNNGGKVSPGEASGVPGVLTVVHNYTQAQYATLMIQIAGANTGQFSVLDVLGLANLSGHLDPVLLNGFVPTIGQLFTFLNYGSATGTLSILDPNIDNEPEHWEISYFPTYATLTVVAGNVHVPDQGSTFLLLTVGFLGLVTFRRQLLCGQP